MTLRFLPDSLEVQLPTVDLRVSLHFYTIEIGICELAGERFYGPDLDRLDAMLCQQRVYLRVAANPAFRLVLRQSVGAESPVCLTFDAPCVYELHSCLIRKSFANGARIDDAVLATPVGDMFSIWDPSGNEIRLLSTLHDA